MKMRAQDGHLFAEVTLREVLERTDVSDMPILSEIKCLYDENAKLRESLEFANSECEKVSIEFLNLQADNAKLRELCEYLWEFAKTHGAYHPFLRELGIEVSE